MTQPDESNPGAAHKRILVGNREHPVARLIEVNLQGAGYEVFSTNVLAEAWPKQSFWEWLRHPPDVGTLWADLVLNKARELKPDLVFLDTYTQTACQLLRPFERTRRWQRCRSS